MPCNRANLLTRLIRLVIPQPIHNELDAAIDNVQKLLVGPQTQLQQKQQEGREHWEMFAKASPVAATTLANRWRGDKFAENMVAFYLAGLADHAWPRILQWLGALNDEDWKDFVELMSIEPMMLAWLEHFRQPIPASRNDVQDRAKAEQERQRRIRLNQQQNRTRSR